MSEDYIRSRFDDIRDYASVIETRLCDEPDVERLVFCSNNFRKDCTDFSIPCLEISEKYDIDEIMDRALSLMDMR